MTGEGVLSGHAAMNIASLITSIKEFLAIHALRITLTVRVSLMSKALVQIDQTIFSTDPRCHFHF